MSFSLTYKGVAIMALAFILKSVDLELENQQLVSFVETFLAVAGAFITLFGRWRAGGVSALGIKR